MHPSPLLSTGLRITRIAHIPKAHVPTYNPYTRHTARTPLARIMEEPLQGLFAINKPKGISSGDAVRKIVRLLTASSIFTETLSMENAKRMKEAANQRNRRKVKRVDVKVGHGGTLDPMATGVLVIGVGKGTKSLQAFLDGTKSYVTKAMWGCETDTCDALGKVLRRAPHDHITTERVEEVLGKFRGPIMQKPPLYSALHYQGKRYYEYAREGIPLPIAIAERPVATEKLELVEFTREHDFKFPTEEAPEEVKLDAKALDTVYQATPATETVANAGEKRERSAETEDAAVVKKAKTDGETQELNPPIATIAMDVTKGFYVRSLVHDLGIELNSAAHMVELVRTRQAEWELGKNVIEWEELMETGEEVWGPKVEGTLRAWWEHKAAPKEIVTSTNVWISKADRGAAKEAQQEAARKAAVEKAEAEARALVAEKVEPLPVTEVKSEDASMADVTVEESADVTVEESADVTAEESAEVKKD